MLKFMIDNTFNLKKMAIIYLSLLTLALFFPFDYEFPRETKENQVERLSDTNGIEFLPLGIVSSVVEPKRLYRSLVNGKGITVEIWLSSKKISQRGPARILSYSHNKYLRNFTIGQDNKDLVFRLRTTESNLNGQNPEFVLKNVFLENETQHIVLTYDFSKQSVYIDGKKESDKSRLKGDFSNWGANYSLVIGNELTGSRPWNGAIFLIAIYNRSLSENEIHQNYRAGKKFSLNSVENMARVLDGLTALYLFNGTSDNLIKDKSGATPPINLFIPAKMQVTNKAFLRPAYEDFSFNFENVKDLVINIVFFIPIGLFLHILVSRQCQSTIKSICIVIAIGFIYTLVVETAQYFFVSRSSSMTDIIHNTTGVILGVIVNKLFFGDIYKKAVNKVSKE